MSSSRAQLLGGLGLLALLLVSAIAGPVMGQATTPGPGPEPSPTGNATNDSSTGSTANGSTATGSTVNSTKAGAGAEPETGAPGVPRVPQAGSPNGSANGSVNGSANGSVNGSDGGLDLGVPSAGDVADVAVNETLGRLNRVFVGAWGTILKLPWRLITVRFAPFESIGDASSGGLWNRPPGVFGELYDLATGSLFQLAASILGIFFLIDWLSNFSPNPRTMSVGDRLFRRAGDVAHLPFSWPIAWAHFLLASILCAVFLPPDEVVVGGLTDLWSQFAGVASLIGFTLVFSIVIAIAGGYLLLKHAGAFVYLLVGIVAYPILVAASIPDHPVVGRLGEYATSAREGYVVAAWYPVPTAFVLGVGYWIDQAVLSALTLGGPIGEVGGGGLYYPVLFLSALYAPEKVFKNGSVPRRLRDGLLAAGAGGAAGAATGSAAGASSATAVGSASGAAGALPAGAGAGAGAGATSAGAGSVAATSSRMRAGSPGASALADGGTTAVRSPGGGDGAGPLGDDTASTNANAMGDEGTHREAMGGDRAAHNDAMGLGGAGEGNDPDGLTRIGSREEFDTTQRYEPTVQHDSGDLARVSPPKDANWLADEEGFDRLDSATDDPLYFRGETDGELYDLGGASTAEGVYGGSGTGTGTGTSNTTTSGAGGASGTKDSVRNL